MEKQVLFLISALGALNALSLSIYFAFTAKSKKFSNFFLVFLLLAISIRILKSAFLFINPNLANEFIHLGLSTCVLIGPFLYLYLKSILEQKVKTVEAALHTFSFIIIMTILGYIYPYRSNQYDWQSYIIPAIYLQWFLYLVVSFLFIKSHLTQLLGNRKLMTDISKWALNIYSGVFIIFLSYIIGNYTSYLVGTLSLSFVLYLSILLWSYRKRAKSLFHETKMESYENKDITASQLQALKGGIGIINQAELYKNPNLKLADLAKQMKVSTHLLSQYLNEHLNKSFNQFVNESRINEAKKLLISEQNFTIETIGYESGFNSKSTFYSTFKKITGKTPLQFKNEYGKS